MMRHRKFSAILSLLLASSILASCGLFKPTIVTETVYVDKLIPVKEQPAPLRLLPVKFKVVTQANLEEFLAANAERNGGLVFVALDVFAYENLSMNTAEFRRYIEQQKAVVVYYEELVKPKPVEEPVEE